MDRRSALSVCLAYLILFLHRLRCSPPVMFHQVCLSCSRCVLHCFWAAKRKGQQRQREWERDGGVERERELLKVNLSELTNWTHSE